jgi:hypothetical protein
MNSVAWVLVPEGLNVYRNEPMDRIVPAPEEHNNPQMTRTFRSSGAFRFCMLPLLYTFGPSGTKKQNSECLSPWLLREL